LLFRRERNRTEILSGKAAASAARFRQTAECEGLAVRKPLFSPIKSDATTGRVRTPM
jgi:hypothetical protein